jgi:hypothetical protein
MVIGMGSYISVGSRGPGAFSLAFIASGKYLQAGIMFRKVNRVPQRTPDQATAMETVDHGVIPVALINKARTSATICSAMKKKMVGGSIARNSSLILAATLLIVSLHRFACRDA